MFQSDFLRSMSDRGFIHQISEPAELDRTFGTGRVSAYIGFDCTKPSLHVGSLVQIMMLRELQRAGHRPIVLFGGGTTMIGDPSGKDEERPILTREEIEANKAGIRRVFSKFLDFGPDGAVETDNAEWLLALNHVAFLRDVGRHFTVNRMLSFDSVKRRLDGQSTLSFLAFNYMVLQAYDFVEIHRRYGCVLQMGGSDQWGNIVNGIDLARRSAGTKLFALTSPLLETADGRKMGKTADGAVWLDPELTSPYEFWQYFRNVDDRDVSRLLMLFGGMTSQQAGAAAGAEGGINAAKIVLADKVTALLHGEEHARKAREAADAAFSGGTHDGLPTVILSGVETAGGLGLLTAFVRAGLASSVGEARRKLREGGLRLRDEVVHDERAVIPPEAFAAGPVKLSLGRKRHVLLRTGA